MKKVLLGLLLVLAMGLVSATPTWSNVYWVLSGQVSNGATNFTNFTGEVLDFHSFWSGGTCGGACWTIFEFDNGNGTLYNVTENQNFAGAGQDLVIKQIQINNTIGSVVRFRTWVNDSPGVYNATNIFTFNTTSVVNFTPFADERSMSPLLVNLTSLNSTAQINDGTFILNFTSSGFNVSQGVMHFTFINSNSSTPYYGRALYFTVNSQTFISRPEYLLSTTDLNNVLMPVRVIDSTGAGIGGANVTQEKSFNGNVVVLDNEFTATGQGSDGLVSISCHIGDSYTLLVSSPSGNSFTGGINCIAAGLTITLSSSGGSIANFTTNGNNQTTVSISPTSNFLSQELTNITGYFNNTAGLLVWWGMNITQNATIDNSSLTVYPGPSVIFFANSTNGAWGGQVGFPLNTTVYPGNYSVELFWDVQGYSEQNYTFFFYPNNNFVIGNATNINLYSGLTLMSNSLDPLTKIVISVVVSGLGAGVITGVTGLGGGIVAMGFLGFFALVNFVPPGLYVLMLLLGLGLFVIRVRG